MLSDNQTSIETIIASTFPSRSYQIRWDQAKYSHAGKLDGIATGTRECIDDGAMAMAMARFGTARGLVPRDGFGRDREEALPIEHDAIIEAREQCIPGEPVSDEIRANRLHHAREKHIIQLLIHSIHCPKMAFKQETSESL